MVADGGAGLIEVRGEVADADFGLAGDESGEAEADGVAEGFEHGCDPLGGGFVHDGRGEAAAGGGLDGGQLLHQAILTYIESAVDDVV